MEKIRTVRFRPYLPGKPTFTLTLWDTFKAFGDLGHSRLRYRLTMGQPGVRAAVIFDADDFGCAAGQVLDSDSTVASVMVFLTLRPGDTDPDYFARYTQEQLAFASAHAESLSLESTARFGEE